MAAAQSRGSEKGRAIVRRVPAARACAEFPEAEGTQAYFRGLRAREREMNFWRRWWTLGLEQAIHMDSPGAGGIGALRHVGGAGQKHGQRLCPSRGTRPSSFRRRRLQPFPRGAGEGRPDALGEASNNLALETLKLCWVNPSVEKHPPWRHFRDLPLRSFSPRLPLSQSLLCLCIWLFWTWVRILRIWLFWTWVRILRIWLLWTWVRILRIWLFWTWVRILRIWLFWTWVRILRIWLFWTWVRILRIWLLWTWVRILRIWLFWTWVRILRIWLLWTWVRILRIWLLWTWVRILRIWLLWTWVRILRIWLLWTWVRILRIWLLWTWEDRGEV
ncbi:uncharacterized protein LOC111721217 [Sarcophilus harrisii]|uniref:uncharacterized protein LOC111721217 n=1 Tax=Sarcophilus harrisii TaxID=9305 RepID=UPI0013019F0F|nr:uncharacterized protein LOC111721217 [Sarcophilus harrisii]